MKLSPWLGLTAHSYIYFLVSSKTQNHMAALPQLKILSELSGFIILVVISSLRPLPFDLLSHLIVVDELIKKNY